MSKKNINNILDNQITQKKLVESFNTIISQAKNTPDNFDLLNQANEIAEKIIDITRQTYENNYQIYNNIRGYISNTNDNARWAVLNKYIEKYISADRSQVKILDVGAGNGRDIIYGQNLGYDIVGIDNCNGFINLLSQHSRNGLIKKNGFKKCDMRDLDFPDGCFDVVRHNASFLHLPLIGENYTVDLAIKEVYRVLKPAGLLYVLVKEGSTLEVVDTNENLGERVYQFFTHKMLNEVVTQNGFTIVYTSDERKMRGKKPIDWILLIAQKI